MSNISQTLLNENSRTLAPEAVASQVAIMSVVSVSLSTFKDISTYLNLLLHLVGYRSFI